MKMDANNLILVVASVVNPLILTGFLIPQVQKLKEIRDRLIRYRFTYVSSGGEGSKEKQEQQVKKFDQILKSYTVRMKDVKRLAYLFFGSLVLTGIALIWTSLCSEKAILVGVAHFVLQIGIAGGGIYLYAVHPDKLRNIDFLVRELDINPISIMNAIEINYSIGYAGAEPFPYSASAPLHIFITPNVKLYGFRMFFVVYDADKKIYFASWGLISGKTKWYRHMLPDDEIFGGELSRIPIGSFAFNKIVQEQKELSYALFLFVPFFKSEVLNPLYAAGRMPAEQVAGAGLGGNKIGDFSRHEKIEFRGQGEKVFEIRIPEEPDFLCRAISQYEKRIRTARKLQHWGSMDGVALRLEVGKAEK